MMELMNTAQIAQRGKALNLFKLMSAMCARNGLISLEIMMHMKC
jgi:hypothetical protein